MLTYPHLDPVAFNIGPIKVHWYGLMYLCGFALAWILANYRAKKNIYGTWTKEEIADLIFYSALGVILGGRIGYMLVYAFPELLVNPWRLFAIWDGGMSFHGGLIGVVVALLLFCRKTKKLFWDVCDFIAPLVPLGLAAGRLGNFINGELWGRVTTMPWGMVFPNAGTQPRHPSQLYEFFLEGVVLFIILWCYSRKPKPRMAVSGLFALSYGCFRFFVEFFRQPDAQLNFIAFGWLTMGQLLSVPLIILGIWLLVRAYHSTT